MLISHAVLLVYCTVFCVSQENEIEFRRELNRAIATCYGSNEMLIPGYTATPSGLYWISGTDNGPKHMYWTYGEELQRL